MPPDLKIVRVCADLRLPREINEFQMLFPLVRLSILLSATRLSEQPLSPVV